MHRATLSGGAWVYLLLATLLGANTALVVRVLPTSNLLPQIAQAAELVGYTALLAGASLLYVHLRLNPRGGTAWLATAALFGSVQALGYAALQMTMGERVVHHVLELGVIDVAVALVLVIMLAAPAGGRDPVAPLLLGVSLALLVTTGRLLVGSRSHSITGDGEPLLLLSAATLALFSLAAFMVLRMVSVPLAAARGLAAAAVSFAVAHALTYPVPPADWRSLVAAALDLAGAAFLGVTALRLVRGALTRLAESTRQVNALEAHLREDKELLHEVASTVAGIVAASHLVATDQRLRPEERQRLEGLLRVEQARLERLMSRTGDEPMADVDLDALISLVVLSHQIRGRVVDWRPTGARVLGRAGGLTEVLDILLNNAAVHSGSPSVEVSAVAAGEVVSMRVSDEGCGIPAELTDRMTEWGTRGSASHGQGIGLSVARRLVAEMGGGFDISSDAHRGTTVTVSLPLARSLEPRRPASILERGVG